MGPCHRSIQPLKPLPRLAEAAEPPPEAIPPEAEKPKPPKPVAASPAPKPRPGPPALAPLEPKLRRRLSRGAEVDARLDLHGLTQAAAHGRLIAFLRGAQGPAMGLCW